MTTLRRTRRRAWLAGTLTVLVAVGATAGSWLLTSARQPAAAEALDPVTAPVEWATLTSQVRINGELTFGAPAPLPAATGMITALPAVGDVVAHGEQVFAADGDPVVLFTGAMPFWRELSVESSDGDDVRQLQENLRDLGFLTATPSGRFGPATQRAVRAWQRSLGVEVTGVFLPSSVVVVPHGDTGDAPSIRVAQVTAHLGDAEVSPATVHTTTLHATATITEAQSRELVPGTPVTVALRDGTELEAAITTVDPGGQVTADGVATAPSATVEFPDQSLVAAVGQSAVRITVQGDDQPATLVVPAAALLATAGGRYAVEVWDGEAITRVPVEIGLTADARVQVVGGDLAVGDLVVLAR